MSDGVKPMGISEGPYNGKPNPHAWMSAENAMIYVDNIRDALAKYDPDNAAVYQKNAERYKAQIHQTLAPLHAALAKIPANKRWLVTSEGRSLILPAITICKNCTSGRSTPISREHRNKYVK